MGGGLGLADEMQNKAEAQAAWLGLVDEMQNKAEAQAAWLQLAAGA